MPKSVKRILKNSFFQTFGAFGITGLNFLLMFVYAKILGPEEFGSLVTSQAQVLVWSVLVELGLSHSLIGALTAAEGNQKKDTRHDFRARDLLFRVLFLRLSGALVGACFIYFLAFRSVSENGQSKFWQDIAFTPHLFALAFQQTAVGLAMYRHKQILSVMANLSGVSCTVFLSLFLAIGGFGISWLLLAQSWGGFLSASIIFGYFFFQDLKMKKTGASRRIDTVSESVGGWGGKAWLSLSKDAWPYAITYGVFVLWQRLDQIAVSHFLGFHQGGQYALAVRLVAIPILIATSISFALFPDLQRLGRDAPEKVKTMMGLTSKLIWRYGILLNLMILFVIGVLMSFLLPKFQPALKILVFFAPGIWAYWMQSFLVNALFGLREYRLVVKGHLISLFVYLPVLYFFTKYLGLLGVVFSFNVFCISMFVTSFFAAKKTGVFALNFSLFSPLSAAEKQLFAKVFPFFTRLHQRSE